VHRPLTALAAGAAAASLGAALLPALAPAARRTVRPWATVNVCDPPERPGAVGVRAFVPRRRATTAAQWIRVRLQYRDDAAGAWRPVRSGGDGGWSRIGSGRRDVKGGRTFTFPPPAAGRSFVLRGIVQVEWRRRGRLVARTGMRTTAGHADRRDPRLAVSRRVCRIVR
jgi:hypothetical protein